LVSGLFESISKELVELDLVSGIIEIIGELVEVICSIGGIDFIEVAATANKDDRAAAIFIKMLPQRTLDKVE